MAQRIQVTAPFRPLAEPSARAAFAGVPAEVVAAIAGAVACVCGPNAAVTGIRPAARQKSGRSVWSIAGLLDATRAF